jgi:hypothetical protein
MLIYVATVIWCCHPNGVMVAALLVTYAQSLISVWCSAGFGALIVVMVHRQRAGQANAPDQIIRDFFAEHWQYDRLFSVVLPFMCVVPQITFYNLFKELYMPRAGFWFGRHLARTERSLLGTDAWRLTHRVMPGPWATQAVDLFYHGWFIPMVVGIAICSFARPGSRIAWRYLTSYLLLWSLQGTLIAYFLPAAGPALHAIMHTGPSAFSPLADRLRDHDLYLRLHGAPGLYSVQYQHILSSLFGSDVLAIGAGISAMPSMHNAMSVLFACAVWSIGRRAGLLATAYAFAIWFSSVHLRWHYALDGVVACALTILTWYGVGRLGDALSMRDPTPAGPMPDADARSPSVLVAEPA